MARRHQPAFIESKADAQPSRQNERRRTMSAVQRAFGVLKFGKKRPKLYLCNLQRI